MSQHTPESLPVAENENLVTEAHAPASSDGGVAASLGLNTQLFVFQLLNFTIVALIVWFLILKPLTKKLEDRKKIIDESLDKAKEVETNLAMSQQKYQEKLEEAKGEAQKIIEKAHTEGEVLSNSMKVEAKNEIEKLVFGAKKKIQEEKEQVMQGIKSETAELVIAVAEKILNEKLNDKKDKELIEESLKSLQN